MKEVMKNSENRKALGLDGTNEMRRTKNPARNCFSFIGKTQE